METITWQSKRLELRGQVSGYCDTKSFASGKNFTRQQYYGFKVLVSTVVAVELVIVSMPDTCIAGVGKTFLTSKVIEHTRRRLRCSANPEGFAFFYCNRNDEERRQPLSVLRSYVRQLSTTPERPERIRKQLQEQCSELRRNGANLGLSDCSEQLLQSVDLYPKTTLVLDALDECDQSSRRQIVKAIELLLDSSSLVKIFISSRPDGDIRNRFCNIPSIEIRATDNEEDIKKFVRTEMAEHSSWKMFSQDLQRDVIEVLFSKSQGM